MCSRSCSSSCSHMLNDHGCQNATQAQFFFFLNNWQCKPCPRHNRVFCPLLLQCWRCDEYPSHNSLPMVNIGRIGGAQIWFNNRLDKNTPAHTWTISQQGKCQKKTKETIQIGEQHQKCAFLFSFGETATRSLTSASLIHKRNKRGSAAGGGSRYLRASGQEGRGGCAASHGKGELTATSTIYCPPLFLKPL